MPINSLTKKISKAINYIKLFLQEKKFNVLYLLPLIILKKLRVGKIKKLFSKKILVILFYVFLFCTIVIIIVFAYYWKDIPSQDTLETLYNTSSTKIYDRTGTVVLYDIYDAQKRTVVDFEDIPKNMIDATISAEDDNFYNHFGIDLYGLARAVFVNITNRKVSQGGSTITQQLIKNTLFAPKQGVAPRTIERKIKELILTIQTEIKYSKEEILSLYLNQIPYGSNSYGVATASQTYFQKNTQDITLAESALLASLPKAPSYYLNNQDKLRERQMHILNRMKSFGYITEEEYKEAISEKIKLEPSYDKIIAPHFVLEIKQQLEDRYGSALIESGGLKIITTIDLGIQEIAEKAILEHEEANQTNHNASNAALVVIDNKTGQILAMVGSKDYFNEEIDGNVNVVMRERQPGSSFKPFAYAAAFAEGYTANTVVYDVNTEFNSTCKWDGSEEKGTNKQKCYNPRNYEGGYFGAISLKEALAQSRNIPAVKILYLAGIDNTIHLAQEMGITTLKNDGRYGLSLVLGGGEVTLLEETAAYSVFATGGEYKKPKFILEVRDQNGEIIDSFFNQSKKVLNKNITDQITHSLSINKYRIPVFGESSKLHIPDLATAVKTGTTQEYKDAWTVGYTPSISVGVWGGNNDNRPMKEGAGGSRVAAPIWNTFMQNVYEFKKNESDEEKSKERYFVLPKKEDEKFKLTSVPTKNKDVLDGEIVISDPHSILHFVKRIDPDGEEPKDPKESDAQYENWEKGIRGWAGLQYGNESLTNDDSIIFITPKNSYILYEPIEVFFVASTKKEIIQIEILLNGFVIKQYSNINQRSVNIKETIQGMNKAGYHNIAVKLFTKDGKIIISNKSFSVHQQRILFSNN